MGHRAAEALDLGDDVVDDLPMQTAECAIDLDQMVVAVAGIADQLVGARQTTKTQPVGAARWHIARLIDDHTRERTALHVSLAELVEHLGIGNRTPGASGNNRLSGIKNLWLDDRREGAFSSD